ncbi:MAG: Sec-independent protein translocase subunit TatB [Betaproteobacteria bacterium]|jgi:sec-independent protein translocase protein TatB|nr:Sec-independent protein translocase subunit TatB [Betaproteobacteria bacterium]NBU49450.1 Sec-independent protein translocase subunit TatB [Betaproteobacteria bacterium]
MIDFGFDKLALIGAVALIVIGPEKLPKVARTVGHLMGKAQRYVADVKAEVNRSIELEELKKMKTQFETAARDVEQSVQQEVHAANASMSNTWEGLGTDAGAGSGAAGASSDSGHDWAQQALQTPPPAYTHPKKKWRLKRAALPNWYKQRQGVRTSAQSGAARVARYRPKAGTR